MQYRLKLTVDDGSGAALWTQTFRTLKAPAHPGLHVKYITAIPADAVLDMAHRIDRANVVAVPTNGDFIDASTQSLSADAYTAALKHHQSALVVTDLPVLNTAGLGVALNRYCNAKHGVVVAGQTHWLAGGAGWNQTSAIGHQGDAWEKNWSLYYYEDITAERATGGGDLAPGSVQSHFLTKGLTHFHVVGPGSGAVELRDYAQGHVLAKLKAPSSGFFNTYHGEFLLSEHQIDAGRVVDLGFRPWSKDVSGGGFDPADSPGGSLTARALWWATNRIPPTNTHFTSVPPKTSPARDRHRRRWPPRTPTRRTPSTSATATRSTAAAGSRRSARRSCCTTSPRAATTRSTPARTTTAGTSTRTSPSTRST